MPRNLPLELLLAKNAIEDTYPWYLLLDIDIPINPGHQEDNLQLYIVNNRDPITFNAQVYTAYPFGISLPTQTSAGEMPKTELTVHDVDKTLRRYIDDLNGGYGTTVILRLVHADSLAVDYSDLTLYFDLMEATIDKDLILISLGAPNLMRQAYPPGRYMSDYCQWTEHYGGVECKLPLAGNNGKNRTIYPTCNGSKAACEERANTLNFGGHPGLSEKGLRVA